MAPVVLHERSTWSQCVPATLMHLSANRYTWLQWSVMTGPTKHLYCGTMFTLVYQAHGQQANRRAVDQVLACLCASLPPSTSKKLVAGMPQATSGTCSRM